MPENSTATQPPNKRRSKGGAPKFNSNALVSGRYSSRTRFSQWRGIAKARPDLAETEAACEAMLCQLESEVVNARGEMTLEDSSACDVATGALFVQLLARRHILAGGHAPDVEMSLAKDELKARMARHEFIVRLDLNKQHDPWAAGLADVVPVRDAAPDAPAASVGGPGEGGAA